MKPKYFTSTREVVIRVVYDQSSGDIVHTHQVLNLPGAEVPSSEDVDKEALALACQSTGKEATRLAVLAVKGTELNPNVEYKVDLKKSILISTDARKRARSGRTRQTKR